MSRRRRAALAIPLLVLVGLAGWIIPAQANHPEVSLPGSDFEIDTDANAKVDHTSDSASKDWANVAEMRKDEANTGQQDDSFVQGTKEDSPVPTIDTGGIPPNKSDLKTFGLYEEKNANGRFLHMYWTRVQDPSGTTNMDFEFNHNTCTPTDDVGCSANGVTPTRVVDDLLVTYDLTKGGSVPVLSLRKWDGSVWGPAANLTASGDATGSINTASIPANESGGLGKLDPRTFGEATIDLAVIFDATKCESFGGAYLKSRSSAEFNSAMKDFVPPAAIKLTNCGSVKIIKTDDSTPPVALAGAEFTLYNDNPPNGTVLGAEDTATAKKCTTGSGGICTISSVLAGQYWLKETVTPPSHETAPPQHVTIVADETVEKTFVNPKIRGAIRVTKTRKHAASGPGDHAHAGVTFTAKKGSTVVASGQTASDGTICFGNLVLGTYTVTETVPAGYKGEAPKTVVVDNAASCNDATYVGESVAFSNIPLTDITVSVNSQVNGGTNSNIDCTGLASTPADTTGSAFDDTSETYRNLEPGTYDCTVVVDP